MTDMKCVATEYVDGKIKLLNGRTVEESELDWQNIPTEPGWQAVLIYLGKDEFQILKRWRPEERTMRCG